MKQNSDESSWISIYIYFKGDIYSKECDEVILKVVNPLVEKLFKQKLIDTYFFIRYGQYGSHIRLRFYGNTKTLNKVVKEKVESLIEDKFPPNLTFYPTFPNRPKKTKNYLWIDYEPEIERYGGENAISIAEEFFFHSSNTAVNLIKEIDNGNKSSRLGKGLLTMVILLNVFAEDKEAAKIWIKNYGKGYLKAWAKEDDEFQEWEIIYNQGFDKQSDTLIKYISTVWNALEEGAELNPTLDYYKNELTKVKLKILQLLQENKISKNSNTVNDWRTINQTIVSSYIHMMNNRLGISILEESYLAYLITNTFETIETI